MAGPFLAHPITIGQLLSHNDRKRVVVPRFQCGFSWKQKHIEAFWQDLKGFIEEREQPEAQKRYFLGPVVTLTASDDETYLLDGQQRLATTVILVHCMRHLARTYGTDGEDFAGVIYNEFILNEDLGRTLELGELDDQFFKSTIQEATPKSPKATLTSHRNIESARKKLMSSLEQRPASESPQRALAYLKSIRLALKNDIYLVNIPVDAERDAYRIFETLNDRGLKLSVPDLLLNYLMRTAATEEARKEIRKLWNEMVRNLGKRDISHFLRHMWVSTHGDLKANDLFTTLKQHIEEKETASITFIQECAEECEAYVGLFDPKQLELSPEAERKLDDLVNKLEVRPVLPLLLSLTKHLLPDSGFTKTDFEKAIEKLLVFHIRYSVIAGQDAGGYEDVLYKLARSTRKLLENRGPRQESALSHVKSALSAASPNLEVLREAVKQMYLDADEAKYLLTRLATHLQTRSKETQVSETNVEHIFPQSPSEEWSEDQIKSLTPYLWHVGNLTLFGKRLNTKVANREYAAFKREYYMANSELEMVRSLASSYTTWDEKAVLARAEGLVKYILEVWDFDNSSRA